MEKDFLTMILDAKGAPVQPVGAMEGLSLQNAARGFELCANGQLKHRAPFVFLRIACDNRGELTPSL